MLYRITQDQADWDRASIAAAALVTAEIVFAWTLIGRSVRIGGGPAVLFAIVVIASVIILARCRLPVPIKASLLLGLMASALGCVATQGALGARTARSEADAALADAAAHADDRVHVVPGAGAGTGGERVAAELESTLASRSVTDQTRVALSPAEYTYDPARPYRLHWTLERDDDRLWCGDYTVEDRRRPDVSLLADRVTDALKASRHGELACE